MLTKCLTEWCIQHYHDVRFHRYHVAVTEIESNAELKYLKFLYVRNSMVSNGSHQTVIIFSVTHQK